MNHDQHAEQIARAILPYFDWIDQNGIESLGSCLKDFGIHIEIDEIHGSATQVVPRRLTFIKEVPDLSNEDLSNDVHTMDLPPTFLIDGNDLMGVSLCDSQEIIDSSRSTPPLSFDLLEMNTSSQGDSPFSDMLVSQQTEITEIGMTQVSHDQWPIINMNQTVTLDELYEPLTSEGPVSHMRHSRPEKLPHMWSRLSTEDMDAPQQGCIHNQYGPSYPVTPVPMPHPDISEFLREEIGESLQSYLTSPSGLHTESLAALSEIPGHPVNSNSWSDVRDIAQNLVRPDLIEYMEDSLSRWKHHGIWQQPYSNGLMLQDRDGGKLMALYSYLCKLEANMHDDQVRMRMVLIELHKCYEEASINWKLNRAGQTGSRRQFTRGRGEASSVIDTILNQLHGKIHDEKTKAKLRAQFHNKKRFGKRWQLLAEGLGFGIVLACSEKLMSVIHSTTFTTSRLRQLIHCAKYEFQEQLHVVAALNSAAKLLFANEHLQLDISSLLLCVQNAQRCAPTLTSPQYI